MASPNTPTDADAKAAAPEADGEAPASSSPTDDELIARARAKDFGAFEELLGRYEDKVFRLAYRILRNETDAKEILQETFVSIWRKLDTFKGDSQFGSWVYRIATNAALMRLRSHRRHPEVSTEELPIGYLFVIRDVEGLSTEETAEVLGISVPTVKTRLHRARIALRDAIGGYFDRP